MREKKGGKDVKRTNRETIKIINVISWEIYTCTENGDRPFKVFIYFLF